MSRGKNSPPPPDRIIKDCYTAFHKTLLQSKQSISTGVSVCQQKEQESFKKREMARGKLLQELQRKLPTSQTSFQSSATARAGLQLSGCCRRLQQTTLPIISIRRRGGGKAVLITAEETASQGNAEAAAWQQTGSSTRHDEIEMHVHRVILLYCTSNSHSTLIRINF